MSEQRIVNTENGLVVQQPYHSGCRDYAIGLSSALFWTATLCGYAVLWQQHLPEVVYAVGVVAFVVCSLIGSAIVVAGYTNPVWLYELLEGGPDA